MAEQICPACFRMMPAGVAFCPACGADLAALSARGYRDKLLDALEHPLADVRMRVIIALALRGEPETAGGLVKCALRHPADVVQGLAIVEALARLGAVGGDALASLVTTHPAHAVREAAHERMIATTRSEGPYA